MAQLEEDEERGGRRNKEERVGGNREEEEEEDVVQPLIIRRMVMCNSRPSAESWGGSRRALAGVSALLIGYSYTLPGDGCGLI